MEETLDIQIGELLRSRGLKLATAESCTGGLIAQRLTNIPGSSDYFLGGVVAYSNEAKVKLLSVSRDLLREHGAVSREVVLDMARGVRVALAADIAVSVSGIAGPGGGTPETPVGTIWIGLVSLQVEKAWRFNFNGNRMQIKSESADVALQIVLKSLQGNISD